MLPPSVISLGSWLEHRRQLAVHHLPTVLGALERLVLLEARVLEEHPRTSAIGLEAVAHLRVQLVRWAHDPAEDELARRYALQDFAAHDQAVGQALCLGRDAEREVMSDARLEVVRVHP